MPLKTTFGSAVLEAEPDLQGQFSQSNVLNSMAAYLASKFLSARYLIFWHPRGAVQTSDGWYFDFQANRAAYLADPVFAGQWASARGVVTLASAMPAVPRFATRLTDDASVGPADETPVPVLAVEVGPALPVHDYALGTTRKWRQRHLIINGYVRTDAEQGQFLDRLAAWFDPELQLTIADHDAGDLGAVGSVMLQDTTTGFAIVGQESEARTFEVILNTRLVYVA